MSTPGTEPAPPQPPPQRPSPPRGGAQDLFYVTGGSRGWWLWAVGGAAYGVLLRVLFGWMPNDHGGAMSLAFLLGTPFVIGALAVYGARHRSRSALTMIFAPWVAVSLMLVGCAVTMLEGAICLAIMSPLFFGMGTVGGLAMGLALHLFAPDVTRLRAVVILPLLILLGENRLPAPEHTLHEVRESVVVAASPERIWAEIVDARDIHADELPLSLTHLIGVPKPVAGINVDTGGAEVRFSTWERGVNFRGLVVDSDPGRSIRWKYEFDAHSFPPGSMDEHVEIGGRYFDLSDTTFNLEPLGDGRTRLEIVAHYRVTSRIDFYAVPVARLLGRDFVRTILGLYKGRSERDGATAPHVAS